MSECEELRKDLETVNNSWQKEMERVKELEEKNKLLQLSLKECMDK